MLEIDLEKLENWIKETFHSYKHYKNDFLVNTPFKEGDKKYKLSISPEKKCYHCWKTESSGPIWDLVMKVDPCSKQEAIEKVYKKITLSDFDKQVERFKKPKSIEKEPEIIKSKIELPESFQYVSFESQNETNLKALKYCIQERQINPIKWRFGYCTSGSYVGRLIITFFDREQEIYYWIARSLYGLEPKYLNPPVNSQKDIKKEEIMFVPNWNIKNKDVIVVEGTLDAIVLNELGFTVVAIQGKTLSPYHIEFLKGSRIIFGLDNDEPGRTALMWNARLLNEYGIRDIRYVFSPTKNEDWNTCFTKIGDKLKGHILKNIKNIEFKDIVKFSMKKHI